MFSKLMISTLLAVLLAGALCVEDAQARRRWFRWRRWRPVQRTGVVWSGAVGILDTDQAACLAEAQHMAAHDIRGHVFGLVGTFEGCGWSTSPTCGTCLPHNGMTLTGDATVQGSNGMFYRVRSWR